MNKMNYINNSIDVLESCVCYEDKKCSVNVHNIVNIKRRLTFVDQRE